MAAPCSPPQRFLNPKSRAGKNPGFAENPAFYAL
jgi:hypothetical protein